MFCVSVLAERIKGGYNFPSASLAFDSVKAFRGLLLISFTDPDKLRVNLITEKIDTLLDRINAVIRFHLQPHELDTFPRQGGTPPRFLLRIGNNSFIVAITIIEFHAIFRF